LARGRGHMGGIQGDKRELPEQRRAIEGKGG